MIAYSAEEAASLRESLIKAKGNVCGDLSHVYLLGALKGTCMHGRPGDTGETVRARVTAMIAVYDELQGQG